MAKLPPSQLGLQQAAFDPAQEAASRALAGEAGLGYGPVSGGRSITDLENPQWGHWLDLLNAAAPGGVKAAKGPYGA